MASAIGRWLSGEQVTEHQGREAGGVTIERDRPKAAPIVPAVAPAATLEEVDAAIATRREALTGCDAEAADLARRLAVPPAGRLKALLTGEHGEDLESLADELADVRARRARIEAEIRELDAARAPFLAATDCYTFDTVHRPKLRAALADISRHLTAAATVYRDHAATIDQAEALHRGGIARGIIAHRHTGGDLPAPDARELVALAFWRSTLTGERPNMSKLQRWQEELIGLGIDLKGGTR